MKQILLPLFFVASMTSVLNLVHAQPNESNTFEKRSSIGFGFMSAGEIYQRNNILPAAAYKLYTKNGTFRAMVGGSTSQNSNNFGSPNSNRASGSARIGYQYNVLINRLMPYMGLDACAGLYEDQYGKGTMYSAGTKNKSIGLSPTIGFEFWFVSKLSCYFEIRSDFIYRESVVTNTIIDPWWGGPSKVVTKTSGVYTHIPPVGTLMMAFHF